MGIQQYRRNTSRRRSWRSVIKMGMAVALFGLVIGLNTHVTKALETPAAPQGVRAITGGTSIAVTWAKGTDITPVKNYDVYRNGSFLATVTPGTGMVATQLEGRTYIDSAVTRGTTYEYKILTRNIDNITSAFSSTVNATHPLSANTTPVPTVVYSLNGNNDLQSFIQTYSVPEIKTWYPKLADSIARGGYAIPTTMTLDISSTYAGVAQADQVNNIITVNAQWLRDNAADSGGMFLHEMTHILARQYTGTNTTRWVTEGLADWTREFFVRERKPVVQTANNFYYQGYSQGAALLNAGNRYNANFTKNLNIALRNGTFAGDYYAPDFVRAQTGKSVSQLWAETGGRLMSDYTDIRGFGGRCIDIPNLNLANGTDLKNTDCNNQYQRWAFVYDNGSRKEGVLRSDYGNKCMDVDQQNGPVGSGTGVQIWDCNLTIAQKWVIKHDGSLVNPASGLCLDVQTFNGVATNNAPLQVWNCSGQAWQKWNVPAFNGSMVGIAGVCADVAGFNPANGTPISTWGCLANKAQEWSPVPYGTSTTSFAMRALGKCMDVSGAGTANGTKIVLWDCAGNVAQEWRKGTNGSLVNPNSGKCLQPTGGSSAGGVQLEISTCNGSAAQNWNTAINIPAVVYPV